MPPWRRWTLAGSAAVLLALIVVLVITLGLPGAGGGGGVDAALDAQVRRDFLADQAAAAAAAGGGDQSGLAGRLTGNALQDFLHQQALNGPVQVQVQPQSLEVLRAADPSDPTVSLEVHERGVQTLTFPAAAGGTAPAGQQGFDGRYWLRQVSGRYAITDESVTEVPVPASGLPVWLGALAVLALLALLIGAVAVRRRRASAPASPDGLLKTAPREEEAPPGTLVVRTLGGFRIVCDGEDLTATLERKWKIAYVWQRLRIGALAEPGSRLRREDLAQELGPLLDRATVLNQLKSRLFVLKDLPAPIAACVEIGNEHLAFQLERCRLDLLQLFQLGRACTPSRLLPVALSARVDRVLAESAGAFLPGWEALEVRAGLHDTPAAELVAQLRARVVAVRADLLFALGETCAAVSEQERAIAVLQQALELRPDRGDVARRLIACYRAVGRDPEANDLHQEYAG
ncbi:MAG: tetratricopeptide repeat protein [Candidatus Dormibacteraceae bacterium]